MPNKPRWVLVIAAAVIQLAGTERVAPNLTRRRRGVVPATLVAAVHAGTAVDAHVTSRGGSAACDVRAGQSQRITLRDGSSLTIDAASIATNGQSVAVAGTPIHVWAAGATSDSSPRRTRPAIGVIRETSGAVRLVPAPPTVPTASYPRIASAGAAGWHFLFVTGKLGATGNALAFEQAELWYGRFDGRRWQGVQRVAHARSASLLPGMSSDLVLAKEGLAFAYSYDRSNALRSNSPGNQGLVLLHRRFGRWSADTLRTWEGPRAVALTALPDEGVLAAFAQTYFQRPRPRGPALFTARYRSAWEDPRLVLDLGPQYVAAPMVASAGAGRHVLAWQTMAPGADTGTLDWGIAITGGQLQRIGPIGPVAPIDRPAMLRLDDRRTVWLARNGASRGELRVLVREDSALTGAGVVRVPLHNFAIVAAPLSGSEVLVVSGGLGDSPHEPPASSYFTVVAVKCPAVRQ
jgi:hypothetical protein